jgi:pilus assembly protein Flp/PilA
MIAKMNSFVGKLVREEEGATLVEYVLLVALIAVVCIVAITAVGGKANNKLNNVSANLN